MGAGQLHSSHSPHPWKSMSDYSRTVQVVHGPKPLSSCHLHEYRVWRIRWYLYINIHFIGNHTILEIAQMIIFLADVISLRDLSFFVI